jgi:acyl-CoA thioester hydrolase
VVPSAISTPRTHKVKKPYIGTQHIYFDMLDMMGILHNAAYVTVFERARTAMWAQHGFGYGTESFDWPYLVARNEINYRAPIRSEEDVRVIIWVKRIGTASITFAHAMYNREGTLVADSQSVLVRVDMNTGASIPWSQSFRTLVEPLVMTDEEAMAHSPGR